MAPVFCCYSLGRRKTILPRREEKKKKKKEDYLIGVIFRIFLRRGRQALLHVMVDLGSEAIAGQYRFAGISGWSTVHVQPVAVDSQQPANCF